MKRFLATAAAAVAGLVVAGPAAADIGYTLEGAASVNDAVVTLISNTGDAVTTNDASVINFTGTGLTTFASLTTLSAEFNGECGGGSPRFTISFGENKNVFVYLGPAPSFTGCTPGTWTSTGNLIGTTEKVFDLSQLGAGGAYLSYAEALAFFNAMAVQPTIQSISANVDSGWFFADKEQTVLLRNVKINETTFFGPAQTKPKHAAQCKNGGWSSFTNPEFKNQGQCVKYVTHQRNAARKAAQQQKLKAQKAKAKGKK